MKLAFPNAFLKHSNISSSVLRMETGKTWGITVDECFLSFWPHLLVSNQASAAPQELRSWESKQQAVSPNINDENIRLQILNKLFRACVLEDCSFLIWVYLIVGKLQMHMHLFLMCCLSCRSFFFHSASHPFGFSVQSDISTSLHQQALLTFRSRYMHSTLTLQLPQTVKYLLGI